MAESSISLVSKTTLQIFFVRFSSHTGQVFKKWYENLTGVTWKPDCKFFCKVVLDTRDIEDSSTMFRFSVSTHKKKWCTFEKFSQKFGPIWRSFRFETTVGRRWLISAILCYTWDYYIPKAGNLKGTKWTWFTHKC